MTIIQDKVVLIDYTLKNAEGKVIDSSEGGAPLAYLHGSENIVAGLERELEGKKVGDNIKVVVTPEDGYGVHNEALIGAVPREMFESDMDIEVGMTFQAETDQGVQMVSVVGLTDKEVTVDGNHPLAGETLHFDVTVSDIRDATEEELEHGHVHSEGCDHHH
ncbi:MAG: peptidylprolyl isomerase [Mariprofundaceae bacterium]|nr:peptidylprolyl isomerase [Mariprofundaceae bacterium]